MSDLARLHIWQIQPIRDVLVVASLALLFYLGYLMSVVTVPLLLGLLLAYLFEPLIGWMARRLGRPLSAGLVIVALVLLFVGPVVGGVGLAAVQGTRFARQFSDRLPGLVEQIEAGLAIFAAEGARVEIDEDSVTLTPIESQDKEATEEADAEEDEPRSDQDAERNGEERPRNADPALGDDASGDDADAEAEAEERPRRALRIPLSPNGEDDEAAPNESPEAAEDEPEEATTPAPVARDEHGAIIPPRDTASQPQADQAAQEVAAEDARIKHEAEEESTTIVGRYALQVQRWLRDNLSIVTGSGRRAANIGWGVVVAIGYFIFTFLFLTPFFFFFWSIGFGRVKEIGASLIPINRREHALEIVHKMDRAIAGFVRGRLTIAVILGVLYTLAYWLIGVPAPLILGPAVGALSIVPYLPLIGWPASIIALAISASGSGGDTSWWWVILAPTVVYWGLQTVDDYVLTPLIQGRNVGLDTPVILVAVLGGGALMGIYGVLVAIPLAACIKILLTEVVFPHYRDWAEGKAEDPLPISRE